MTFPLKNPANFQMKLNFLCVYVKTALLLPYLVFIYLFYLLSVDPAIKVLDKYGEGNYSDVIAGIEWAVAKQIDIVNMSFGNGNHSLFTKSLK